MRASDIQVHYGQDARSVHVLLRVTDPDTNESGEVLIDNLTTAMHFIVANELIVREEIIGFAAMDERTHPLMLAWRAHASGDSDEALIIDTIGDPALLNEEL